MKNFKSFAIANTELKSLVGGARPEGAGKPDFAGKPEGAGKPAFVAGLIGA